MFIQGQNCQILIYIQNTIYIHLLSHTSFFCIFFVFFTKITQKFEILLVSVLKFKINVYFKYQTYLDRYFSKCKMLPMSCYQLQVNILAQTLGSPNWIRTLKPVAGKQWLVTCCYGVNKHNIIIGTLQNILTPSLIFIIWQIIKVNML